MELLSQPSKTWSPNEPLNDPSTVNYDSADEKDASNHQVLWSNLMNKGDYLESSGYHNIEVLMLCWDQEFVDLATQEEVEKLKTVFEDKLGFHATIAKLSLKPGGRKIQVQVNQKVAKFVNDHDGPNNLLIVYYAGHGKPGQTPGDLELFGQTSPNDRRDFQQRQRDRLVWNKTEELLKEADADILEIFDCCYAGTVGLTRGDGRLFEFLAAAKATATTAVPGKESFTSALIYALVRLVEQKPEGRFTTVELLSTIKEHAPHFPKDQDPLLVERGDSHTQAGRVMLHPIQRDGTVSQIPKQKFDINEAKKHTVTLHFDFASKPSNPHLETLGQGMNEMFKRNNLEVLPPRWGGMRASATACAVKRFQTSLWRRRSSKREERPTVEKPLQPRPQVASLRDQDQLSLPTPPRTGYHTQDSAVTTDFAASGSADSSGSMESRPRSKLKRRRTAQNGDNAR